MAVHIWKTSLKRYDDGPKFEELRDYQNKYTLEATGKQLEKMVHLGMK